MIGEMILPVFRIRMTSENVVLERDMSECETERGVRWDVISVAPCGADGIRSLVDIAGRLTSNAAEISARLFPQ